MTLILYLVIYATRGGATIFFQGFHVVTNNGFLASMFVNGFGRFAGFCVFVASGTEI